jgi:tetrahydromethanopterin S-methyltransferase subunit C
MPVIGLILGAIVGVVAAALICGTIAFLALIERHLAEIAAATRQPRS